MTSQPALPPLILALEVGNLRVKCGVFDRAATVRGELPECLRAEAFPWSGGVFQTPQETGGTEEVFGEVDGAGWDAVRRLFETIENEVAGGDEATLLVAGSNPAGVQAVLRLWPGEREPEPVVLDNGAQLPLEIDVEFPEKVGLDRLLNAVAANAVRGPGQPAVIVDSGTAVTVDLVSATGAFQGGAILPGVQLAANALHDYTAQLPLVEVRDLREAPPAAVGRNTRQAIQSGLYWGHVGAVGELVAQMLQAAGGGPAPLILLTGGAAPLLLPHLRPAPRWEPHLTLQGMVLAWGAGG